MKKTDEMIKYFKNSCSKEELEQRLDYNRSLIMAFSEKIIAIAKHQEEIARESDMLVRAIADYEKVESDIDQAQKV